MFEYLARLFGKNSEENHDDDTSELDISYEDIRIAPISLIGPSSLQLPKTPILAEEDPVTSTTEQTLNRDPENSEITPTDPPKKRPFQCPKCTLVVSPSDSKCSLCHFRF